MKKFMKMSMQININKLIKFYFEKAVDEQVY